MSGIQIQVDQMIVVLHQGEPCTYRGGPKILSLARRRRWLGPAGFGLFR